MSVCHFTKALVTLADNPPVEEKESSHAVSRSQSLVDLQVLVLPDLIIEVLLPSQHQFAFDGYFT